ncbi:hypothetical protein EI555_004115, partial [Monodon monoceros]
CLWFGALCWHRGRRVGDFSTLGVGWAASWESREPVASCPWALGSASRLFRTFVSQEEGRKAHPGKDLPETIPYLEICTIGHQVPDDDTSFKFQCAVNGFLKENKD